MPEWSVCPHCSLKHSRRPDGLCPRCREPVAGSGPAPAASEAPPVEGGALPNVYDGRPLGSSTLFRPAKPADHGELSLGARIGGAILVANGLALLIESGLNVTMGQGGDAPTVFRPSPVAMLIDLALGGWLVTGNPKGLPWAKFRVVAGGLILPAVFFWQGQTFLGGLQLAFSLGLALLLFGNAGRLRIAAGLLATGSGLALETVGLFGIATGTTPLAHLTMAPGLEREPVQTVEGEACPYHLTAGGDHWYLRKAEAARKDNALADRWIVWPERDAHVLVIAEHLDASIEVDMDRFAEVVLGNARKGSPDLKVLGRDPLPNGGVRLHTQATVNGIAIESYYGLYTHEHWIFQVVAFSGRRQFSSVESELETVVASFEAPSP